ncbi:MAG TPA: hypothetical protein VK483_04330 [Chitinophagaceae bacterium]|nr:hypothetical protein [Chitinophagaceae bacterium]
MKKLFSIYIIITSIVFSSCRSKDTKTDVSDTLQKKPVDTASANVQPEEKPKPGGTARSIEPNRPSGNPDKNKILANIDKYLVSTVAYPDPGTVAIKNTLPNVTVQKAIIEVTILKADGTEARLDYYIVNNIEPGDSKTVKIAGAADGVTARCHVVKLNSNELTGGETVMVGIKYVPQ